MIEYIERIQARVRALRVQLQVRRFYIAYGRCIEGAPPSAFVRAIREGEALMALDPDCPAGMASLIERLRKGEV